MANFKLTMSWKYSDDTVMHLATARSLLYSKKRDLKFWQHMAKQYKDTIALMPGRAPGKTCMKQLHNMDPQEPFKTPYRDGGGGCGASMRSACIGLAFNHTTELKDLIQVALESGRMTHHHSIGYLGAVMSALFTRLAIEKVDPNIWMAYFFDIKP